MSDDIQREDLTKSWKRTEIFLREARINFSEAAEGICEDELHEFGEYLQHNELELALDMLDEAYSKSGLENLRVIEFMALAAASMGLTDRQQRYDSHLSIARGWKYETKLPGTNE